MVGTHFPEDRDVFGSALQRVREAFDGLRDGRLSAAAADDLFQAGYEELRDIAGVLFDGRRRYAPPTGDTR